MPISEVYNEDCMIGMSRYSDKYFDLAIVDPPYMDNFKTDNWVVSRAKQNTERVS